MDQVKRIAPPKGTVDVASFDDNARRYYAAAGELNGWFTLNEARAKEGLPPKEARRSLLQRGTTALARAARQVRTFFS